MRQALTGSQVAAITHAHHDLQGALYYIDPRLDLHDAIQASIDELEDSFPFLAHEADDE